jgi:hypothetical protein
MPHHIRHRRVLMSLAGLLAGVLALPGAALGADHYVAPGGSDGNPCTAVAPCQSFDRAYRAAAPGQLVEVAAGSYGGQNIPGDGSKTSEADVVFAPAPGAAVSLSGLDVRGSHAEVRDIHTGFVDVGGGTITDVTVRNGGGSGVFIGGGTSQVRIIGGSYGAGSPNVAPVKIQGSPAPSDITFDGVIFHDAVRTDPAAHLECIYAADVQRFTVRNSQFRNCAIMDLFITKLSGVNPRDVLIENNFFDITGSHSNSLSKGYYTLMVASHLDNATNFTIRNNSLAEGMSIDAGSVTNFKIEGNVGPLSACRSGVTYAGNVWTSRGCSSSDRQAPSGFKDVANYDLHLRAGAAAIDAMTRGTAPGTDIDGDPRPKGRAPDAGADEFGIGSTPGPAGAGAPTGPGGVPFGGARRATRTTLRLRRTRRASRWRATGRVTGAHSGRVTIRIQRRSHGHWRRVATRRVRLRSSGRYSAVLRFRRSGRYRVRAAFAGSRTALPSRSRYRRLTR